MATWFSCKIKYQKQEENGKVSKISEQYLVDAMSFTEAEARLYFELGSTVPEFMLTSVSKMNLQDLFHYDDSETWFKCKVVYVSMDEKSGKEKKIANIMLVSAQNVKQAYERIEESLSTMLVPFEITDINQTAILEIFPYIAEDDKAAQRKQNIQSGSFPNNIDPETGELLLVDKSPEELLADESSVLPIPTPQAKAPFDDDFGDDDFEDEDLDDDIEEDMIDEDDLDNLDFIEEDFEEMPDFDEDEIDEEELDDLDDEEFEDIDDTADFR
jgi:hypothetical protein